MKELVRVAPLTHAASVHGIEFESSYPGTVPYSPAPVRQDLASGQHPGNQLTKDVIPLGRVTAVKLKSSKRQTVVFIFRVLLWLVLALLHVFSAAFYGTSAYIYDRFESTALSIQLASFQLTIATRYFPVVTAFHAVISICHLVSLLEMISRSATNRELVFHRSQKTKQSRTQSSGITSFRYASNRLLQNNSVEMVQLRYGSGFCRSSRLQSIVSRASSLLWSSFDRIAGFDARNRYFSSFYMLRESVECVLQSVQAYRMSRNVPRVWFNRFGVVVVAVNCWTTPVFHRLLRRNSQQRLIICLLFGLLLDVITSIGITAVLAVQYLPDYDSSITNFDVNKCWSNALWYSFMLTEFRQLIVRSWLDFFTHLLFSLMMLLSMEDVKMHAVDTENISVSHDGTDSRVRKKVENVAHIVMVAWGFIIVGLHAEASLGSNVPECIVLTSLVDKQAGVFVYGDRLRKAKITDQRPRCRAGHHLESY